MMHTELQLKHVAYGWWAALLVLAAWLLHCGSLCRWHAWLFAAGRLCAAAVSYMLRCMYSSNLVPCQLLCVLLFCV
jgi:glucan phosphoethanolaminetransferase (alkaline phosphatase superfamily)